METTNTVAQINIDRTKPQIELIDITSSNQDYPNYANSTHLITGHLKLTETNIVKNNLSSEQIKVAVTDKKENIVVNNYLITPNFESFSLISDNGIEKIYEFSFTNATSNGTLIIAIPPRIIRDKAGLYNESKTFYTNITIDNTPPQGSFNEITIANQQSRAEISLNEPIRPIVGWNTSNLGFTLSKEFSSCVCYPLPIVDFAGNSSEVLINIKNATSIFLEYSSYDDYSRFTKASNGAVSSPNTISSNSICKTEAIMMRLVGANSFSLQGKVYEHTYWGEGFRGICRYSELSYYHGYNPTSPTLWWTVNTSYVISHLKNYYTQFGGTGVNSITLPNEIGKQYLFGISAIQFKLKDTTDISVVYQGYINGIGWLQASSDGEENCYQYNKPFSSFRINLVPKTEKQYLINYWNRNVGTNSIN
ncbi:MAG: hypothetical protein HFJ34_02430 [Clostridia bacterium]|nr:hypothetical protein [Clostridia bacterium]